MGGAEAAAVDEVLPGAGAEAAVGGVEVALVAEVSSRSNADAAVGFNAAAGGDGEGLCAEGGASAGTELAVDLQVAVAGNLQLVDGGDDAGMVDAYTAFGADEGDVGAVHGAELASGDGVLRGVGGAVLEFLVGARGGVVTVEAGDDAKVGGGFGAADGRIEGD